MQLDIQEVKHHIQSQFPSFVDCLVTFYDEGTDHFCYLINEEWIFRFPKDEKAAVCDQQELLLLPFLAPLLPLPIPQPVWIGEPWATFPYAFTGYRKLNGNSLSNLDREDYVVSLAHFLKTLHALQPSHPIKILKERMLIPSIEKGLKLLNEIDPSHQARIIKWIREEKEEESPARYFVHGDLYARHVLGDKGVLTGVIDWGSAGWGDIAIDLSLPYSSCSPSQRELFFSIYGPISVATQERSILYALYFSIKQALKGHLYHQPLLLKEGLEGIKNAL